MKRLSKAATKIPVAVVILTVAVAGGVLSALVLVPPEPTEVRVRAQRDPLPDTPIAQQAPAPVPLPVPTLDAAADDGERAPGVAVGKDDPAGEVDRPTDVLRANEADLRRAIQSPDAALSMRLGALRVLIARHSGPATARLVTELVADGSSPVELRVTAVQESSWSPSTMPSTATLLLVSADARQPETLRVAAVHALSTCRDTDTTALGELLVREPSIEVRLQIIDVLTAFADVHTLPHLEAAAARADDSRLARAIYRAGRTICFQSNIPLPLALQALQRA